MQGHLQNQNTDQLCVWPQALNSLNKLHKSLKPWNFNSLLSAGHQAFSFTSMRIPHKKVTYNLNDTSKSNRNSAPKHPKTWSSAWPALWKTAHGTGSTPADSTACPLTRSKVPWHLQQQAEVLVINAKVSISQTTLQCNYFITIIIKKLWKYILYFIRGQSTVLTFPFPQVRHHSLLTRQDRLLNLYLPIS